MAEPKHTPGPWLACRLPVETKADQKSYVAGCVERGDGPFFFVACEKGDGPADVCHTGNGPNSEANARLIATAPTMLEALKEAARHIDSARVLAVAAGHAKSEETFTQAVAALDLVIAKAEGRS